MFASPWKDALIVLFVVLLFFGPKRLPALSRSIGESIKEFKGGIAPGSGSEEKSELTSNTSPEAPAAAGTGSQQQAPAAGSTGSQQEAPAGSAASEHTSA